MITFATDDEEAELIKLDLPHLLDEMAALFDKYVTFTDSRHAAICSLWCASTWLFMAKHRHGVSSLGYMGITSPEPDCGKSSCLLCLGVLSYGQPNLNITPTSATIFRDVGMERQTIILDELDGIADDTDMINILNAGYKFGAQVKRMIGKEKDKVGYFETFCPKAFGYIRESATLKKVKQTLEGRCIRIMLKKRTAAEQDEAAILFEEILKEEAAPLVEQLVKWQFTVGNVRDIYARFPKLKGMSGREQECWRPLFAVAWLAGRFEETYQAALDLIATNREEVQDHKTDRPILADIRDHLDLMCDEEGFSVEEAVSWLLNMEDRSYRKWVDGRGLNIIQLAKILAKYGLRSRPVGKSRRRRIARALVEDVLVRYVPANQEDEAAA